MSSKIGCFKKIRQLHIATKEIKMLDISKIKVGDKVYYRPDHFQGDEHENGMVKEIPDHTNKAIRVVYNCAGNWDNFKDYTSALTEIRDLEIGWKHE